jgi:hypothetical protein
MRREQRLGCLFAIAFSVVSWAAIIWFVTTVGRWVLEHLGH